ncbi:MAG: HAMP domain-containing protein, partial [Anaerolineae bacterium]|nr:HAMP domain-containing protein [Anaerolineae bacterium]
MALILISVFTHLVVPRPLRHLTNVTQRQAQGDLTSRVELLPQDEFGQLGTVFNRMTSQLARLIGNLEQRVIEHTRDLDITSEVTRQTTRVFDMDELLRHMANLTREGFNPTHVSVFLYEPKTNRFGTQFIGVVKPQFSGVTITHS